MRALFLVAVSAALFLPNAVPIARAGGQTQPRGPSSLHVLLVILENHGYKDIIGSKDAPYLNGLAQSGGLATNYTAIRHPSLPNYLALTGGSTFGVTTDCTSCSVKESSLADQIETAGLTWKAYEESIPRPCYTGDSQGSYVKKHNPFIYYRDIASDPHRCKGHIVDFKNLNNDISGGTLPNFSLIIPDESHDMHTGSVQKSDRFLKGLLPSIFGTSAYTSNGALFITWDESADSSNRVATIVSSPLTPAGTRSHTAFDHYSLLKTVEEQLGLPFLKKAGAPSTTSMSAAFL